MATLTKAQKLADQAAAESIYSRTCALAYDAGLIKSKRRRAVLPDSLEPEMAIAQRRKMHQAMAYFEAAFRADETVFHLTWCPSDFYFRPGELDAEIILRLARIAGRHARNLPERRRLIGAVDISFNKELGLWCVHLHAFVAVRGKSDSADKRMIKSAFGPRNAILSGLEALKPNKAKRVKSETHLFKTLSYISGSTVLVDHNLEQRRDRRFRSRSPGSKYSSKSNLPDELQAEVTRVYAQLAPLKFWVISGFRRHGEKVTPEPPLDAAETRAVQLAAVPRPKPKPRTFSAIGEPKPLF